MEKRNYFQPMTKVMSMMAKGAVCEPPVKASNPGEPKKEEPLF